MLLKKIFKNSKFQINSLTKIKSTIGLNIKKLIIIDNQETLRLLNHP